MFITSLMLYYFLDERHLVVKLTNCQIGTKIGVLVDIDPMIMIVVCSSSLR